MKRITVLLLLCMVCSIAGCGKYYYQEGKSFSACERDCSDCLIELKRRADWDMPGAYEHKFMDDCMKEKGYGLVTERKLPIDVKRQDPATTLYGRVYENRRGLSGTIR
jgi:hypothetical protein